MLFFTRQLLIGACNQIINLKGRSTTNQQQSNDNLDSLNQSNKSQLNSFNSTQSSFDPSAQLTSSNLPAYSSIRQESNMIGNRRLDEAIVEQQDGSKLNENYKFNKLATNVIVNERGKSHLINSSTRNRSSSLYNGGLTQPHKNVNTANNSNNLQYPIEPEVQNVSLNQRRNTSCSINVVNDNHFNNYINDQNKLINQSINETDNQLSRDRLIEDQENHNQPSNDDSSSGLLSSVWSYLSNIPKKRSSSKTRNTIYNKLCSSLNSSPAHRTTKKDLINENNNDQVIKINEQSHQVNKSNDQLDQQPIKSCTCKCTCRQPKQKAQSSALNLDDCLPSDIPSRIHEMDQFPFQSQPANKKLDKIDTEDWLRIGKEMVEYIAYYLETLDKRRVTPDVEPGYLKYALPKEAPKKAQEWKAIMTDFEKCILPGITHWQHPHCNLVFSPFLKGKIY